MSDVVATVGTFDGVHRGHQMVLQQLIARAHELGLASAVVTFDQHPLRIVRPEHAPQVLTTRAEKEQILASFDVDMIQAEYGRIGRPPLDLSGKKIVDAFRLWQQCEPRSLQHAHRRFVGDEFASAHSASADVAATGRVLVGMLQHFKLADQDWGQIAHVCDPGRASWVGPSRHLRWENEVIVLGFGKHAWIIGPDEARAAMAQRIATLRESLAL